MIAVEQYVLSQTIADCSLKIGSNSSECVLKDIDSTPQMKNMAYEGWFMDGACGETIIDGATGDGICYHTNVNTAFSS